MARPGKLLVTGCRGQLGCDLVRMLSARYEVEGVDIEEVDICNRDALVSLVNTCHPDVVIHAAAYTDVDGCETNSELAMNVNGEGTRNVAKACREIGARMIYYSTDYVFNGRKDSPYVENDPTSPQTVYGKSKLAGEQAVQEMLKDYAILRIAWVYGRHGKNFVKTMLKLGKERAEAPDSEPLRVVDDQFGNPTWTEDIVRQTEVVIENNLRGIYHATSEREVSWFQFARDIFDLARIEVTVEPCTTGEFPRPAPRPRRSSLENAHLKAAGFNVMRDYREALVEFMKQYAGELAK